MPNQSSPSSPPLIDRTPPYDLAAEAGVLGSLILDAENTIAPIRQFLPTAEAFFKEENQIVYRVILEIEEARKKVDAMILHSTLKSKGILERIGGIEYIKTLAESVPTSAHAEVYACIVHEKWKLRQVISACTISLRECYEGDYQQGQVLDRLTGRLFKISETNFGTFPSPMSEIMPEFIDRLDKQRHAKITTGLPTGFTQLDKLTGGLQNGEMILVAARPSAGKTSLAMCILEYVGIALQKPCAMFSMEMSKDAIALRMLSSRSFVDSQKIRTGAMTPAEAAKMGHAAAEASTPNIFIDDTPNISFGELRAKALRLKQRHGIVLLAVDYLGLMQMDKLENRNQEVGQVSQKVKALARELNIPVLLLSQLNRKCEDEQRLPRSSDLRDSGNLEQDADVIMLLHREELYHRGDERWREMNAEKLNEADLLITKQRNGAVDKVLLTYYPWCTRFLDRQ